MKRTSSGSLEYERIPNQWYSYRPVTRWDSFTAALVRELKNSWHDIKTKTLIFYVGVATILATYDYAVIIWSML